MSNFEGEHFLDGGEEVGQRTNATLGAARIMKRDVELGSITPGKVADLVLIDGNPATNIGDVRKTSLTMKDGVIYKPAELYSELGILP